VSGAQLRAERVLVNLLALLVFGHFVTQPLAVAVEWRDSRYPLVELFVPAVGLVYGLWLLREAGRSDCRERRSVDVVFIALICAAGLATEVVVSTPLVAASMTSAGYTALGACTFAASFRLSRRASAAVVLVAAIGHVFALRATPTQGVGGALQLLGTWAATTVVVAQVRRAGRDADAASDAARRAEREEASARVHDALGLLRVVARGGEAGEDLQRAVHATARRTQTWLDTSGQEDLAGTVEAVAGQFPDLPIRVEVDGLPAVADREVATVVGRAVHTLLGNVREHAGASHVQITGRAQMVGWRLTIRDDGRGFDVTSAARRAGLTRYTHEALAGVGVAMSLESTPGVGTTVTLLGSTAEQRVQPSSAGRGGLTAARFVSWRERPQSGAARALWISDLIQAGMVAGFAVLAALGFGYLLGHDERPVTAGLLVVVGTGSLVVTWLAGPRPPRAFAVLATVLAVGAGAVVTVLDGADAADGEKLGIMLMVWACMLLALARPDCRWVAVSLAFVSFAALARVDGVAGIVALVWAALASLFAARIVNALRSLGAEADADRRIAAHLERRTAAPVLLQQAEAMGEAAGAGVTRLVGDRLALAAKEAEDYLRPPRPDSLGVVMQRVLASSAITDRIDASVGDLTVALETPSAQRVAEAVSEIATILGNSSPGSTVRVRGASSAMHWQVSLFVDAPIPTNDQMRSVLPRQVTAELAELAIDLTVLPVLDGGLRVQLRPVRSQNGKTPP
jgi:hypothetical protein